MRKKANEKVQCAKCEEDSSEGDVTHHVPRSLKTFSCCRSGDGRPKAIIFQVQRFQANLFLIHCKEREKTS